MFGPARCLCRGSQEGRWAARLGPNFRFRADSFDYNPDPGTPFRGWSPGRPIFLRILERHFVRPFRYVNLTLDQFSTLRWFAIAVTNCIFRWENHQGIPESRGKRAESCMMTYCDGGS